MKTIINDVSVIRGRCKILLRAIGFHPEDNYIRVSVFEVDTRFSFGLLAFTPKKLHMGLRLSEFYARFSFGLMVFTPKTTVYGASVI